MLLDEAFAVEGNRNSYPEALERRWVDEAGVASHVRTPVRYSDQYLAMTHTAWTMPGT
jgi:hypothetical protein